MNKTFLLNPSKTTPGFPIGALLRRKVTKGEIGIEIEVEGNKFPKHAYNGKSAVHPEFIPAIWGYHHDGSLRGQDNAEYVLKKPIKFSEVPKAISDLWEMFDKYGTVLEESNRTSVHVHLNVQEFHLNRLCAFMALYFSVEEILTAWCGEHRIGNLFCLRAKDAPAIVSSLKKFFQSDGQYEIRDGMHYAGLNAQALFKFGSVELRSLRGVSDPQIILDWVSVLQRIYEMSKEYPDPRAIMDNFSGSGGLTYLEMVLGDKYGVIRNNIEFTNQQVTESMYEGIRLAQDLCYCRDWSKYEPVNTSDDPFGRAKVKTGSDIEALLNSMQGANGPDALTAFQQAYANTTTLHELHELYTQPVPLSPTASYQIVEPGWATVAINQPPEPEPEEEDDCEPEWDDLLEYDEDEE